MNLLRDTAILDLQRSNVEVLQEQLRQTRDRFNVGEVTRTDVAQSESRLAAGRSQMLTAESNYTTSRATYRQVIGVEPGRLAPAMPVDRFSPRTLPARDRAARAPSIPSVTTADVQRRCRGVPGQDRRRRALSDAQRWWAARRRTTARPPSLTTLAELRRLGRRPAHGSDLSGRRRIRDHPPGQGDARPAPARPRHRARPGAADAWCSPGASSRPPRRRSRPPRRRSPPPRSRSTACARRPASASAPRSTCSTRSRSWSMPACRWSPRSATGWSRPTRCWRRRAAVAAGAGARGSDLRSDGALPAGARQLGRRAHAGRKVNRRDSSRPRTRSADVRIHKAAFAFDAIAVPYLRRSVSISRERR